MTPEVYHLLLLPFACARLLLQLLVMVVLVWDASAVPAVSALCRLVGLIIVIIVIIVRQSAPAPTATMKCAREQSW